LLGCFNLAEKNQWLRIITGQLSLNMANLGITDHFKHSMTISEQSLLLFIMILPWHWRRPGYQMLPNSTSPLIMSQFNTHNPYNISVYVF